MTLEKGIICLHWLFFGISLLGFFLSFFGESILGSEPISILGFFISSFSIFCFGVLGWLWSVISIILLGIIDHYYPEAPPMEKIAQ